MTQNRVDEALIINQVRGRGMLMPLTANDIIWLQQCGVSPQVIAVMQEMQPPPGVIVQQPAPVVVGGYYYGRPYYPRRDYW
jgi:hypothetical protein